MSKAYCAYHCAACGQHFTSLRAFDFHREGDFEGDRFCVAAPEIKGLQIRENGRCRLKVHGKTFRVKLWEYGPDADRARRNFAEKAPEPVIRTKKRKKSKNRG